MLTLGCGPSFHGVYTLAEEDINDNLCQVKSSMKNSNPGSGSSQRACSFRRGTRESLSTNALCENGYLGERTSPWGETSTKILKQEQKEHFAEGTARKPAVIGIGDLAQWKSTCLASARP
jgi:hypothetical protein